MYVNEVGHAKDLVQNVLPKELGQSVHYYLHLRSPMRKGETVELLVDYQSMYEKSRERKGYGIANLKGEIAGDEDVGTRLDRNITERKEMEKYFSEMTPQELSCSLYFMMKKIYDPVMDSLNRFTSEYEKNGYIPTSKELVPHPRKWIAKRRMEWIGNLMIKKLTDGHVKKNAEDHVVKNLITILKVKKLAEFTNPHPFYNTLLVSNKETLMQALHREVCEEILHKASKFLIRPFDSSIWCVTSQILMKKIVSAVANWKLQKHENIVESQKNLVNKLIYETSESIRITRSVFDGLENNQKQRKKYASNFSFRSSLLSRSAVNHCVDKIEGSKLRSTSNIFNVPPHVAVAYNLKKDGQTLNDLVKQQNHNHIFVAEKIKKRTLCEKPPRYVSFPTSQLAVESEANIPRLDFHWYVVWQFLLVTHGVASCNVEWEKEVLIEGENSRKSTTIIYSLEKLCKAMKFDDGGTENFIDDVKRMLENVQKSAISYEKMKIKISDDSLKKAKESKKRENMKKISKPPSQVVKRKGKSMINQNRLFFDIIWNTLLSFGWTLEYGSRPSDFYYMPPGVTRKMGENFKNRVDFFDSVVQVLNFLNNNGAWKNKKEIAEAMSLFWQVTKFYQDKRSNKTLPDNVTTEWLIRKAKMEGDDGIIYK